MKIGLVLSGGGMSGAYQVGVWQAIQELKLNVTVITGTSIGAVNAAFMVQGSNELLKELWSSIALNKTFNAFEQLNTRHFRWQHTGAIIKQLIKDRGIDVNPFKELLKRYLKESTIRSAPTKLGIVTFCLSDWAGEKRFVEDIPEGLLIDYIIASATFPLFIPHNIKGKKYLDGGLHDNLPIALALQQTVDLVISVDVATLLGLVSGKVSKNNKTPIIRLKPKKRIGNHFSFNQNIIQYNIQDGYKETLNTLSNCIILKRI